MTTAMTSADQLMQEHAKDLRQLIGERRLLQLAFEAAQIVGEGLPRPEQIRHDLPPPAWSLTLLTYCYAAGIYGSEEIELACQNDEFVRYICAKTWPDAESLRRFRRANRPWIEACLLWVCDRACPSSATQTDLSVFVRRKVETAIMMDTAMADCY